MTEVDAFLDDLDRLAATAAPGEPQAFYRQLLPASAMALGADSAEFNRRNGRATPPERWSENGSAVGPLLEAAKLERLYVDGVPRIVPGDTGGPLVVCPVEGAGGSVGVLAYRLTGGAATPERSIELAAAVAEAAAHYELRREADRVASAESRLNRIEETLVRLHAQRGLRATAREAAEQGRLLVGCDRLSVLSRSGDRWRLVSASGVTRISRRSDAARNMERLTRVALRTGEPLRYPEEPTDPTPTPVLDEADRYCDTAEVRSLRVLPCDPPSELGAGEPARVALLAEWFDDSCDVEADALLAALARHVGVAAARDGASTGWRSLGRAAIASIVAALLLVGATMAYVTPATLWTKVDGRFEPLDRARVFAPLDGVVEEVLVGQGERVEAGQPLVRLASPELRLQQEEVAEAIAATEAELAALETAKLRAALPGRDDGAADPTTLASRVAAEREKLEHQRRRRELLEEQAAKLVVTSPIAGAVVSWKPGEYLADRPVRRGQRLMEIADDGQWRIELEAPDHRSGHLLRAFHAADSSLAVEYVVRSDPSQTHHGTVEAVAEATHAAADGSPVVRVVVAPADAAASNPRSGLGVSAKIDCGSHSLGYVWLHEAIEAIRRRWF